MFFQEGRPEMNKEERTRLMVEIARMTYEQNFSQQKIADRLIFSRTYVGKLLDRACKKESSGLPSRTLLKTGTLWNIR